MAEKPISKVVDDIEKLAVDVSKFWKAAHGWAPTDAANLLSGSRLDWLVSLADTLRIWTDKPALTDGELILSWANLGSLLEGTMKLLLSVYLHDFEQETQLLKELKVATSPDVLMLWKLQQFFEKKQLFESKGDADLVELVRNRRNAIHAFADKPIGDQAEFHKAVREFRDFQRRVARRLPYPDDVYKPWFDD